MSAPYSTLYLDPTSWDLVADAAGNIAVAAPPYAVTQDVSSVCSTFKGEVYYDSSAGVDFDEILGGAPPLAVLQGDLAEQALTVPTVDKATIVISGLEGRQAQGQIQFETTTGTPGALAL